VFRNSAHDVSPMSFMSTLEQQAKHLKVVIVTAQFDSPAFREQSFSYHKVRQIQYELYVSISFLCEFIPIYNQHSFQALQSIGLQPVLVDVTHKDHFDVVEDLRLQQDDQTQVCTVHNLVLTLNKLLLDLSSLLH
jgi:hypothetical protein